MIRFLAPLLVLGTLAGCTGGEPDDTGDDEGYPISDQALQGVVGGAAWTFAGGETDAFLSDEEDFFAMLFAETYEACAGSEPGAPELLLAIPTSPGTYQLSLSLNATFVPSAGENLIATTGTLRVDAVDAESVSGAIYVRYDADNELDGAFEVTLCPE